MTNEQQINDAKNAYESYVGREIYGAYLATKSPKNLTAAQQDVVQRFFDEADSYNAPHIIAEEMRSFSYGDWYRGNVYGRGYSGLTNVGAINENGFTLAQQRTDGYKRKRVFETLLLAGGGPTVWLRATAKINSVDCFVDRADFTFGYHYGGPAVEIEVEPRHVPAVRKAFQHEVVFADRRQAQEWFDHMQGNGEAVCSKCHLWFDGYDADEDVPDRDVCRPCARTGRRHHSTPLRRA